MLVEINCETDFVAKNESSASSSKMSLCISLPLIRFSLSGRKFLPHMIEREKEIYRDQVKGKPANVVEKILEGKLDKYYAGICLYWTRLYQES